ncbi:MAG TPA: glycerol-3-phosphate acyltransferase [Trueperaceae bacterium]|nr:glycerol-3-phosphate acyltransferase [Trueperaceae bacterium]
MEWFLGAGIAFLTAFLVGSLPLGARLVERVSGWKPSSVNPHLLGVENVARLVGGGVALGAFGLDLLKGLAAVVAGVASSWTVVSWLLTGVPSAPPPFAAGGLFATTASQPGDLALLVAAGLLGVLVGHLYPLPLPGIAVAPRGRGNGVLMGGLAGLYAFGIVPLWLLAVPIALWAGLVAADGYVARATVWAGLALAALGAIAATLHAVTWEASFALALLALTIFWRHKSALSRISDGTEPRLGDPMPVRGMDGTVMAAFMIHPMSLEDVWQPASLRWFKHVLERTVKPGLLPVEWVKRLFLQVRPQLTGVIEGVVTRDGRPLRVLLIGTPLLPDQFRSHPEDAERLAVQGARFAHELGAEVVGLGAFWSTVGNKGQAVQDAVPDVVVTNGGAYTAATVRAAVPGLLKRFGEQGVDLKRTTAAVVGANGVVAFGVARMIAPEVGRVILVGRDKQRLKRSASTLRAKFGNTEFVPTTDVQEVASADLVFTATSDPGYVLYPQHIRPGAWVYDLGRPADVHPSVRGVPGVEIVPGGVVRPPGTIRSQIDLRFGDGHVPACLAETMIIAATKEYDRRSLGGRTRTSDIEFYLREGERLGFEIVNHDAQVVSHEAPGRRTRATPPSE